jgi:D-alanyl-D-alanine carboxypeptidase
MRSKKMKHSSIITITAAAVLCIGIPAGIAGTVSAAEKKKQAAADDIAKAEKTARISSVISHMSARAQAEIHITDTDAFLSDLTAVLASESRGASDDLPLLVLVDKTHKLPAGYEPKRLVNLGRNSDFSISRAGLSLRPEADKALRIMAQAAQKDGLRLLASSTYRSFDYQKKVYEKWVRIDGQEEADRESARPGTSQHQLGTAVDFGSITDDYAETPEGAWMYRNAAEYGWSLSFPHGYEDVTGYRWECWHFRYIGKEACAFQKKYFNDIQQYMIEFIDSWKKTQQN